VTHDRVYDPQDPLLARLRRVCMKLPEAVEVETWGRPTFRAGSKMFAIFYASPEKPQAVIFKPDPAEADALRMDPRFFVPPYHPTWFAIDFGKEKMEPGELAELVESSYRQVALKRMLAALDSS